MEKPKKKEDEELVDSDEPEKNWRGIIIAILVIIIVFCLIIVAVILVTPKDLSEPIGDPFTFEDMFDDTLQPREFDAKWIGDKNIYVYRNRQGEVMEYNAETNTSTIIMDNSTFREFDTNMYFVSEDLKFVLIAHDVRRLFRHSYSAKYVIYNRFAKTPKEKLVSFPQSIASSGAMDWRNKMLQFAGWSTTGSSLVFIYENNLYYQSDPFTTPTQTTTTGEPGLVYNGLPDWLYEEEVLKSNTALWWAPGGDYIAYAQFDDRDVPMYNFQRYGSGTNIYSDIDGLPYPKAGDMRDQVLPVVTVYVISTNNPRATHRELRPPDFAGSEFYLTSVVWKEDGQHVLVTWTNRPQNRTIVLLCEPIAADCYFNIEVASHKGHGWVEMPTPRFIQKGDTYLTVLSEQDGSHGHWKHIAMVTGKFGHTGRPAFITQGTWDVMDLLGYDDDSKTVYFLGTNGDPRKRHLFSVVLPDSNTRFHSPQCLTCDKPPECQYVNASFSRPGNYYILHCKGPGIPNYMLVDAQTKNEIVVEDNHEFGSRIEKKATPIPEYYEIETEDGEMIWVKILLPASLKKEHITLYPVLVEVYGGPGSQSVTEEFRLGWQTYLTSVENVIYVLVDGRGSAARGDRFLHSIYRKLGTLEVADTIAGGRYIKDSFSYIDVERIGIWGWSYGGFVTTHVLGDESDVFRCGIAVAPVTDWRYYDTAYSERYMGLSSNDNYRGYDNANVSRKAHNFRGKEFLLVHGTADDNVHFQHSAQFAKALTDADVDYRIHIYPDKNHGLSGKKTRKHLYRMMTRFLKNTCWDGGTLRQLKAGKFENIVDE